MSNWNSIVTNIGAGVGGKNGSPFEYAALEQRLKHMVVHYADDRIKAVKVGLSDGSEQTFGNPGSTPFERIDFAPGERITELSMWGNGQGWDDGRAGRIRMTTNRRQTLDVGPGGGREYQFEVESGLLVGVFGHAGSDIDWIGFKVLKEIHSSVLTNVTYPDLAEVPLSLEPFQINRETYENGSTTDQTFTLSGEHSKTVSHEWGFSLATELSISTSVKGGVPKLVETETGLTWKVGAEHSYRRKEETKESESFAFSIKAPAATRVVAEATLHRAAIDIDFKGTLELTLVGGEMVALDVDGTYSGVLFRRAGVKVQESPLTP